MEFNNIKKSFFKKLLSFFIIHKLLIYIKIIFISMFLTFLISSKFKKYKILLKKKRIGVVCVKNEQNSGNMLVKFSMYTKLKEYGLDPVIICTTRKNNNIDFLRKNVKFKEVKYNFTELREKDYDILMVNSDQTWNTCPKKYLFDYGFLRFAKNWPIPKFTYAASFAREKWPYSNDTNIIIKSLLKNFTGISLREKDSINEVENNLGIKPVFVLDPTFLIILLLIKNNIFLMF